MQENAPPWGPCVGICLGYSGDGRFLMSEVSLCGQSVMSRRATCPCEGTRLRSEPDMCDECIYIQRARVACEQEYLTYSIQGYLTRDRTPLGPYRRPTPRVLGGRVSYPCM